jgi:predicted  nucleic acid-binding Zn-ribbon protein
MNDIEKALLEFIAAIVIGVISGYLTYKFKIKNENVSAKRLRLLNKINKVDDQVMAMIELSFLENDIGRTEAYMKSIDETIDLLEQESDRLDEEITNTSEEMKTIQNNSTTEAISVRIEGLQLQSNNLHNKLNEMHNDLNQQKPHIVILRQQIDTQQKRLIANDIGATVLSIDKSGQLAKYLTELEKILADTNKVLLTDPEAIRIRSKIDQYCQELIDKVR